MKQPTTPTPPGRATLKDIARAVGVDVSTVSKVLNNGGPPLLLEPVKATVTIAGRPVEAVNVLDHDGRRTGRTLTVSDGRFTVDGAKDRAIYYEVVFR